MHCNIVIQESYIYTSCSDSSTSYMHILTGCDPCASNIDQEFTAFIAPHLVKTSQDDKDDEDEDGDEDEDEED